MTMSSQILRKFIFHKFEENQDSNAMEYLRMPEGLQTGVHVIDDFLYWRGLPKGDLVLFHGQPSAGSARLWLQTSRLLKKINLNAAWVSLNKDVLPVAEEENLRKFLIFSNPESSEDIYLALCDLIQSQEFSLVGCSLNFSSLSSQSLQHLKALCRQHNVTLVFVSQSLHFQLQPVFSLIIDCQEDFYTIHKAIHRPTPLVISGNMINLDLRPLPVFRQLEFLC